MLFFFFQVESGKKTLILHGTKTSAVLNSVLTQIYHLKKESAVKYSRKNENINPFESGGETSLEFFSQKTDCSIFVVSELDHLHVALLFGLWIIMISLIACDSFGSWGFVFLLLILTKLFSCNFCTWCFVLCWLDLEPSSCGIVVWFMMILVENRIMLVC